MEVARRDLAVWISVTLFICPWHGRLDRPTGIAVANDMAVYAIRVGGRLSELAGQQRRVGLEEALTLFESVSFIGQLLFVAANALVLQRNGRRRRISAFEAGRAKEPRVALSSVPLSLGFSVMGGWNGRKQGKTNHASLLT